MKTIRIVSPAKVIDKESVHFAVDFLKNHGFKVEISANALGQNNYFSGTDIQRFADFQDALDSRSVDIILCTRGGYGSVRIIDQLDFSEFQRHPKLIVGFSDITVFHNHVHSHYNLHTVHATVPLNFKANSNESLQSLITIFNNQPNNYSFAPNPLNREGKVNAQVVGGNLSIIYSLIGTNSDIDTSGKILFIEDVGEYVYAIDRMMYALKKSGKLQYLAGLIVGGMTNIKDTEIPFGKTAQEVISEIIRPYSFPVCFDFPAGHIDDNRALIFGKAATLEVSEGTVLFEQ